MRRTIRLTFFHERILRAFDGMLPSPSAPYEFLRLRGWLAPAEPDFGEARERISPYRRDVTYLREKKSAQREVPLVLADSSLGRRPRLHSRNQFAGTLDADDVSPTGVHYWHPLAMTSPCTLPLAPPPLSMQIFREIPIVSGQDSEYYSLLKDYYKNPPLFTSM